MTRKHFEAIAEGFREAHRSVNYDGRYRDARDVEAAHTALRTAAETVASEIGRVAPTFDRARFRAACEAI